MLNDDGTMQRYALTVDKFLEHAAKWHPGAEVVTRGLDGTIGCTTYRDVHARARRISSALADFGVAAGDKVATLAWNSADHLEVWYAIMGMGAVCHTLNPRLPADHTARMLDTSDATLVIASADLVELASELARLARSSLTFLVVGGDARPYAEAGLDARALATCIADLEPEGPWEELDEYAPCGLCFTSGTTGAPKGVSYTHRASYLHTLRQLQADVLGITANDAVLAVVPMFHANAWGLPFAAPAVGAKLVLPGRANDGASLVELMALHSVTLAVGVPTVWIGVFDHLDARGIELPSLRRIMVGGAPTPASLMERIERRGIEVQTTWGMTELTPMGTATPPGDPSRTAARSGRPAIGLDMKLTDAEGAMLPRQHEAEGHLWVRGHSVVETYLGETEAATVDGWFRTGDLAKLAYGGELTITGRAKDLIKSGGEWINPADIEAIASAHPDVALAAVIGREDEKWGERPVLLLELVPGAQPSDEALIEPLRKAMARWWLPDEIIRVAAIPLAATGKIDKLRLRSEYGRRPIASPTRTHHQETDEKETP